MLIATFLNVDLIMGIATVALGAHSLCVGMEPVILHVMSKREDLTMVIAIVLWVAHRISLGMASAIVHVMCLSVGLIVVTATAPLAVPSV
jgi:hypothetical protein